MGARMDGRTRRVAPRRAGEVTAVVGPLRPGSLVSLLVASPASPCAGPAPSAPAPAPAGGAGQGSITPVRQVKFGWGRAAPAAATGALSAGTTANSAPPSTAESSAAAAGRAIAAGSGLSVAQIRF